MQRHDNVPMYLSHCSMCPVWQQGSTSLLGHAASPPQALLPQPLYGCLLAQNSSLAPLWEACFDSAFLHMLLERDTAGVTADNSSLVCSWEIPRQKNQGELLAALKKKNKKKPQNLKILNLLENTIDVRKLYISVGFTWKKLLVLAWHVWFREFQVKEGKHISKYRGFRLIQNGDLTFSRECLLQCQVCSFYPDLAAFSLMRCFT